MTPLLIRFKFGGFTRLRGTICSFALNQLVQLFSFLVIITAVILLPANKNGFVVVGLDSRGSGMLLGEKHRSIDLISLALS